MDYSLSWFLRRHGTEYHMVADVAGSLCSSAREVERGLAELEEAGFRFEHHPTMGFRVAEVPESIDGRELAFARRGRRIGRTVEVHAEIASTNDRAGELAAMGPGSDGSVVAAEHQTAGRGRQEAGWFDSPSESLLMSLVYWVQPIAAAREKVVLGAAVAVAETIEALAGTAVSIKWPNDIEIARKKVAGILVEGTGANCATGSGRRSVVVGVGVNVNQPCMGFPVGLQDRATSLRAVSGRKVDRTLLLEGVLERLEVCLAAASGDSAEDLLGRYVSRCDMVGRPVTVREGGREFHGTVCSISPQYALIVRLSAGGYRSFDALKVHLL